MLAARKAPVISETLLKRLRDARLESDKLFQIVRRDSLYERPIPERHRIVFYAGHLEAFEWNLLAERIGAAKFSQPEFDRLFAFGIDPVGGGLPTDHPSDWPSMDEVRRYNARVREALDASLSSAIGSEGAGADASLAEILNVAIEHRLMHLETLAYMLHQLPIERKIRQAQALTLVTEPVQTRTVEIPAGTATLGLSRSDAGAFGWDNEYERHEADVPAFEIDEHMITNGQFLKFVEAGGYGNRDFWPAANWEWKTKHDIRHPVFWKPVKNEWMYRGMFDEFNLPLEWPVYASHAEASAYARWAGKALPTEAQWHRAAYGTRRGTENAYPWGADAPAHEHGNFDFRQWDPAPVGASSNNRSAFGAAGLLGNGWEWTATIFAPLPGFQPRVFYPGYSANFFDGKHYVMKGGSPRTAACMLRRSFRNWFQPNYQYVYAGFRCVSS